MLIFSFKLSICFAIYLYGNVKALIISLKLNRGKRVGNEKPSGLKVGRPCKTNIKYRHQGCGHLNLFKDGVLNAIDTKTLSYYQANAVWDNWHAYDFTSGEMDTLKLYKSQIKPRSRAYTCRACVIVGGNCFCTKGCQH